MIRLIACFTFLLVSGGIWGRCGAAERVPPFQYCYYLFEIDAAGCSACYIPLLIMRAPIDQPAVPSPQDVAVIETYERDSIWRLRPTPVPLPLAEQHDALARRLTFEGKNYRYQLVSNREAVRLLQAPEGHIPISRLAVPIGSDSVGMQDMLVHDLAADVMPPQ